MISPRLDIRVGSCRPMATATPNVKSEVVRMHKRRWK